MSPSSSTYSLYDMLGESTQMSFTDVHRTTFKIISMLSVISNLIGACNILIGSALKIQL